MVVFEIELLDGRPAHFQIEFRRDRQHRISNRFRFESRPVHSPEQPIIRINFSKFSVAGRGLAVGRAGDNQPVQTFDRFAVFHEPVCNHVANGHANVLHPPVVPGFNHHDLMSQPGKLSPRPTNQGHRPRFDQKLQQYIIAACPHRFANPHFAGSFGD